MKKITIIFAIFFLSLSLYGQTLKDKKNAFISYSTSFDSDLIDAIDGSTLTPKEKIMYDKFMKTLRSEFEQVITDKFYKAMEAKSLTILPMDHLAKKLNYKRNPVVVLAKRQIKKKNLSEDADYFLSSTIMCSKAMLSLGIGKTKAQINYGVAIFDGQGKKVGKINGIVKSDEGLGRLSFGGVNNQFNKIDQSFIPMIIEKLDPFFDKTIDEMIKKIEEI